MSHHSLCTVLPLRAAGQRRNPCRTKPAAYRPGLIQRCGTSLGAVALTLFHAGLVLAQAPATSGASAPGAPTAPADTPPRTLPGVTVQGVSYGAAAVSLPSTITVLGRRALTQGQPQ
ncbi:MAG: hypothetical protein KGJ65_14720, partial [Betaproteobacteria bacterium]|nr:hypothetical protein [Betaproteobacteria bacterium]